MQMWKMFGSSCAGFAPSNLPKRSLGSLLPSSPSVEEIEVPAALHARVASQSGLSAPWTTPLIPVRPPDDSARRSCVSLKAEAPALPEGEGLVVAVNPRSGPDDYDPSTDIRRLLPRAEILETTPETGVDELLGEAATSGRAKALGVAGGDGSVAAAARTFASCVTFDAMAMVAPESARMKLTCSTDSVG